jgi:hypothetical protein
MIGTYVRLKVMGKDFNFVGKLYDDSNFIDCLEDTEWKTNDIHMIQNDALRENRM